jgi:pimeloyl-ACP methyl ester carboxylesterase
MTMTLDIPTEKGTLHVEVTGTGTPVLLWHSLLCNHQMWRHQVPLLAARHQVINLDMRGHGQSSLYDFLYDYWDLSRDVVRVLDYLDIEQAAMIGLSMGGIAAYHLALDHPERLTGMVAISATADPDPLRVRWRNRILAEISLRLGTALFRPFIKPLMLGQTTLAQRPDVVSQFNEQFQAIRPQGIYHCVRALGQRDNLLPRLPHVEIPALILIGQEDQTLTIERGQAVADALPNAQFKVIPQVGHLCVLEQPDLMNPVILSFLESLD